MGDAKPRGLSHVACMWRRAFYLEALRGQLPRLGEGGALAAVLEHCMYCGMSLGRVGLDFRALAAPLFEAQILRLFRQAVKARPDAACLHLRTPAHPDAACCCTRGVFGAGKPRTEPFHYSFLQHGLAEVTQQMLGRANPDPQPMAS